MKISIVIPVLNEEYNIIKTIDFLTAQSRRPDEIIFVDGGSTDGTLEKIRSFKNTGIPIKLIKNEKRFQGAGRNKGVASASHEIILCLDCGNLSDKHWIQELTQPFEKNDELDVVAGSVLPMPQSIFEKCVAGVIYYYLYSEGLYMDKRKPLSIIPSGSSIAFRKRIWQKVGGYPDWLQSGEDKLFGLKINLCKLKVIFNRNAVVYHHMRSGLWSIFKQIYIHGVWNGISNQASYGLTNSMVKYLLGIVLLLTAYFTPANLFVLVAGAAYHIYKKGFYPYININKRIEYKQIYVLIPLILITRDIASIIGHIVGYSKWYTNPYFKNRLLSYLHCKTTNF